jgi:uncharacterized protein (TIGR00251 family)
VAVHVQPRSHRSEILGWQGGRLRIRTTAAPADGEANREVARQLARAYGVPPSRVELLRGARGRDKIFRISGATGEPSLPVIDS